MYGLVLIKLIKSRNTQINTGNSESHLNNNGQSRMLILFRSMNFRLSIVLVLFTMIAFVSYYSILAYSYRQTIGHSQQESIRIISNFAAHTDYEDALAAMSDDLRQHFVAIRSQQEKTIVWINQLQRNRGFITLGLLAVLGPIFFIFSSVISRYLTRPMWRLANATKRIASGDFSTRTKPNLLTWDNFSLSLANDFDSMASSLEQLETERRTMIADIAHELRTPITSMQLQLEAVQDGIDPLDIDLVNTLHEETELLSALIIDLRTLSLAESRELSLTLQSFNLYTLVEKALSRFHVSAQQKDIDLLIKGSKDTELYADAERVNQMLNNLLSNAIRHTPEGGTVTVDFQQNPDDIELNVINSGSALAEEELAQLFNRFYRAGKGRVRAEGGSGLGLAIVKALTELHNGNISVQNFGKNDIKFSIHLPQNYGKTTVGQVA